MTQSYSQIMKQIARLQTEADEIRRKEVEGVILRIKEAIAAYGLTAADLGLSAGRRRAPAKTAQAGARGAKANAAPKFRDEAGNTWVGRGKRPDWLRKALAAGRRLEEFAVR